MSAPGPHGPEPATAADPGAATAAADPRAASAARESPQSGVDVSSTPGRGSDVFQVRLDVFEGPFDLLLGLIAKHKLDVTEVALSRVTDDFIAYIRGRDWDLGQASEFLVVAATLLDLKAARLLPAADIDDEEDLALLEARDLLFARLLQYRAFKQIAAIFDERMAVEARFRPRSVGLEPRLSGLLPEVVMGLGPEEFAALAARAFRPRPVPTVSVEHLYAPQVSVREQVDVVVERLRRTAEVTFRELTRDCRGTIVVVARFLALLELFREGAVAFEQAEPLGELTVRWTGSEDGDVDVTDEFDDERAAMGEEGTTGD